MPGDQDFIDLWDIPAAEAGKEAYLAIIQEIDDRIRKVAPLNIGKTGDAGQFRAQAEELKNALKQIADMQEKLIKLEDQLAAAKYKGSKASKDKTDQEIRESVAARAEMKSRTDTIKAEENAYKQLALAYNKAAAEAKALQAAARKSGNSDDQAKADAASKAAKIMNNQLKEIDKSVGDTRRNVGNYKEAFAEAFGVLQSQVNATKKSMENLAPDSAQFQNTEKQLMVMEGILASLDQNFSTSRQVLKAYQEAVVQVGLQLGQTDQRFVAFDKVVGSTINEVNDLKAALKFQAQDGRSLQSLVSIVTGLAGAFGAAQAAVALMGDESEETQKSMAKFQQLLVLVNGLQAVNNTLQEENGAIQGVLAAKITLLNIAKKIQGITTAGTTVATEADTVANVENAASQEAMAAATAEATAALEAEAIGATEATLATTGFSTALLATGIGIAIAAIAAGIIYLVSKIPEWMRGNKLTIEQQKALAEAAQKATEVLKSQAEMIEQLDGTEKRYYERQLALSQAAGENAYKQFALREKIAKEEQKLAQETYDIFHQQGMSERQLAGDVDVLNVKRGEAIKLMEKYGSIANPTTDDTRQLNSAKTLFDLYDTQYNAAKTSYDAIHGARVKLQEANNKQGDVEVERHKFHEEELVQTTLEGAKARANAIIQNNEKVLANDNSTFKQRIAAEKNILGQELALIEADRKAKLAAPDITDEKTKQINIVAGASRVKAEKDTAGKVKTINDEAARRQIEAWYEINKEVNDAQSQALSKVSEDVKNSLAVRLAAYDQYEAKQREQINADAEFQKKKHGQTADELFNIEVNRQQKLTLLAGETQAKQAAIVLSALEKQKDSLMNKSAIDSLKGEIKALDELNDKLRSGAIGIDAYNKQKEQMANKSARNSLAQQTVALEFISGEYKRYGVDTAAIDKQIYENKKHLSELDVQDAIKAAEQKKALKQKELELAKASEELIADFIRGGYEKQMNKLQDQIDQNNKLKETESARIQSSTLNETQKAAALQRLELSTAAQNEALERKKREAKTKEAQFDRAKALLDVGINTGVAIMKAVAEFPLTAGQPWAAIAAAMGAVQIASILAKPIPKFEAGTESSPEGLAILHPGEIRENPDGSKSRTPDDGPSLTYLQRGTKIHPRHKVNQMMMDGIFQVAGPQKPDNRLADEMRNLTGAFVAGSNAQIAAIKKIKQAPVVINVSGDIWAHIDNSCKR